MVRQSTTKTKTIDKAKTSAKKTKEVKVSPLVQNLKVNLDDKRIFLLDYENTQSLPLGVFLSRKEETVVYVFLTPACKETFEKKFGKDLKDSEGVIPIFLDGAGKNFLDYGIAMYIGAICATYTPKSVEIVSNDTGYETLQKLLVHTGIVKVDTAKTRVVKKKEVRPTPAVSQKTAKDILKELPVEAFEDESDEYLDSMIEIVMKNDKYPIDKLTKNQFIAVLRDDGKLSEKAAKKIFAEAQAAEKIFVDKRTVTIL